VSFGDSDDGIAMNSEEFNHWRCRHRNSMRLSSPKSGLMRWG